jgi:hypothetical protein
MAELGLDTRDGDEEGSHFGIGGLLENWKEPSSDLRNPAPRPTIARSRPSQE